MVFGGGGGKGCDLKGVYCLQATHQYGPVLQRPGKSNIGSGWWISSGDPKPYKGADSFFWEYQKSSAGRRRGQDFSFFIEMLSSPCSSSMQIRCWLPPARDWSWGVTNTRWHGNWWGGCHNGGLTKGGSTHQQKWWERRCSLRQFNIYLEKEYCGFALQCGRKILIQVNRRRSLPSYRQPSGEEDSQQCVPGRRW